MKKVIAITLVTLTLGASLASCGKFECDVCQKEASGKPHTVNYMGRTLDLCDECNEEYEEAVELYGSLLG